MWGAGPRFDHAAARSKAADYRRSRQVLAARAFAKRPRVCREYIPEKAQVMAAL